MNASLRFSWRRLAVAALVLATFSAVGCDDSDDLMGPGRDVARGRTVFGLDDNNALISFGLGNPTLAARKVTITGLQSGERIFGIDFGPRDNRLYAVGSTSRLYLVDTTTGAASPVLSARAGNPAFTPILDPGNGICVDFNPVPNLVRVQTTTRQNLRLRPDTGSVAGVDTPVAYVAGDGGASSAPAIVGCAYTNSTGLPIPTTTQLFAIDGARDVVVLFQGNPNAGQIATVGPLGVITNDNVGYDIVGVGPGAGTHYASLTTSGSRSSLYTLNSATGLATFVGDVNHGRSLVSIAVAP